MEVDVGLGVGVALVDVGVRCSHLNVAVTCGTCADGVGAADRVVGRIVLADWHEVERSMTAVKRLRVFDLLA